MANKKILLVGGGGHCRSVLDCLLNQSEFDCIGIVEREQSDAMCMGVPIVGIDDDLPRLFVEGWTYAAVTVGSVGNTKLRRKLAKKLKEIGFTLPVIMDPTAVIGRNVSIGEGAFVGKRTVVNAGSSIGGCAIVNTAAVLEHDCVVGDFAHISPGAILCGEVCVGDDAHVGAGSVIRQQTKIGRNALVGAGSVVVCDLPGRIKAYGNPCKVVERL